MGRKLVISGFGSYDDTFPAGGSAAFFEDDFESASIGSPVNGRGANGFTWGGAHDAVYVSDDISRSGTRSLKAEYGPVEPGNESHSHWWAEQNFNIPDTQEVWFEWYAYFPDGTEGFQAQGDPSLTSARYNHEYVSTEPNNNKWISLWADQYNGEPSMAFQSWSNGSLPAGDSEINFARSLGNQDGDVALLRYAGGQGDFVSGNGDRGRWIRHRVHVKISDIGVSNGEAHFWVDDNLCVSLTGDSNWDEAETHNFIRNCYLFGYDNARFTDFTAVYIDDFKFWNTDPGWI